MKIAIQGHPIKGHKVIQILESLGGVKLYYSNASDKYLIFFIDDEGYISCFHHESPLVKECFKIYTLEEFEKDFPFKIGDEVMFPVKIGWESGKIIGLTYIADKLKYEVHTKRDGYSFVEPHKLQLYPMKEERNVTLTLDKAKEWYKKGGELKEIALQAFTEEELNPLPRSWEEFCEKYPVKETEAVICCDSSIADCKGLGEKRDSEYYRDIYPSKKSAEAHLAMIQLEQLRDCWRQGWIPSKRDGGFGIRFDFYGGFRIIRLYSFSAFLSFPTEEIAEEFLECFRDLIEKAGDLI